MKKNLKSFCIDNKATIRDTMKKINVNTTGAAVVVNVDTKVLGIVTDGDIRRAILNGKSLDSKIEGIYNKNFKYASQLLSKNKIKEFMLENKIRQLPVLNDDGRLIDLLFIDEIITYPKKDNYVFILAGGLGTRLRPLTEVVPKPMLKVGDKPILQVIIEQFKEFGFSNFIISLNYLGDMIESYFKDGKKFNVNIEYVRETKKLGTAGSLELVNGKCKEPMLVINGDILTGIDFDAFLNHHIQEKNDVTVGSRIYEFTVPYGVMVTENDNIIKSIEEKPTYSFYINSGVYAINPDIIKFVPEEKFYNMTDLIKDAVDNGYKAGVYDIKEYWADIGQINDYKRANDDIKKFF